jgi:hypothetical protein
MTGDYRVGLFFGNSVHEFRFIGGPIEDIKEGQPSLTAFGHAAAAWARMEQHINALLIQLNKKHHSDEAQALFGPEHPMRFTDKIRLLRSYFNKHPALSCYTEKVRDLCGGLSKLATKRNEMLHGILESYDPSKEAVVMNKVTYRQATKDFLSRKQTIPLKALFEFTRAINIGHYALCDISKELFSEDGLSRLRRR